ncbi:hypothetical protein CEXT_778181 [Caerostris extrusa]|uniref:Uncharacterized protein n=1 Tax=Caerostris extrusa TaxID=172846 RepID=A0AAV4R7B3_CAEEX|nr:hypothetical protein CEXT_778181 [Caerostris extrusa]
MYRKSKKTWSDPTVRRAVRPRREPVGKELGSRLMRMSSAGQGLPSDGKEAREGSRTDSSPIHLKDSSTLGFVGIF